jgi:hypothetical protein
VDDLLEQAGIEPDITTACQLFQKAEDMIIEDSVWVLQWRRTDGYVIQEWIQGFNPGGMGEKYELLDTVWISQDHRQITRIPQNTGQQDNELTSHGAGVVVLALIVTAFILKRRPK